MNQLAPLLALVAVSSLLLGCVDGGGGAPPTAKQGGQEAGGTETAKALMIIAPSNFRDEELFHTREELENAGVEVTVASKSAGTVKGSMGGTATADKALSEVNVADYDAIVFVGGPGSSVYYEDSEAHGLAAAAVSQGKVLAAICIAPGILAKAGVLQDRRATIWDSGDGAYSRVLEENGATYTGEDVTTDGKIITANGPQAAHSFGRTIAGML